MRIVKVFIALATAAFAACNDSVPTQPPSDTPALEGVILGFDQSAPSIRLELDSVARGSTGLENQAKIHLTAGMPVVIRNKSGQLSVASISDIRAGVRVRAWVADVVLKSLPPQYVGEYLEIRQD